MRVTTRLATSAVLLLAALLVASCGGSHPAPPKQAGVDSPSASPTETPMSRSEFLILAGSVCGELALARQVMAELPTYNTARDRATGLRTIADVLDTTHDKMTELASSAPRALAGEFRRSVVNALARMTTITRTALTQYRDGHSDAAAVTIDRLVAAQRPFLAYAQKYQLGQCGL